MFMAEEICELFLPELARICCYLFIKYVNRRNSMDFRLRRISADHLATSNYFSESDYKLKNTL